jgi:ankyrin repeat protein
LRSDTTQQIMPNGKGCEVKMKHYIYNTRMSEALFARVKDKKDIDHSVPPKIIFDTVIAQSVEVKFYRMPWNITEFTLGCFKKDQRKVRYFFLYHAASGNVIVFPKYTVDKGAHSRIDHYKWLRAILPPNKVQSFLQNFIPDVEHDISENTNSNAIIIKKLEQAPPIKTIMLELNTLTTFQSIKSVEALCAYTVSFAKVAGRPDNHSQEWQQARHLLSHKWKQCLEQSYAQLFFTFDGHHVALKFCHTSRPTKTFDLEKHPIQFWQNLLEMIHAEYADVTILPKALAFLILSCRLHPQCSFSLFAKYCTLLSPDMINVFLLEVTQASMQEGRLEYDAINSVLSLLQQHDMLHIIHKKNIRLILKYMMNRWNFDAIYVNDQQTKTANEISYLATLEKLLPYTSANIIPLLIKPTHEFLTPLILKKILIYTKQLFAYEKIECVLRWLHSKQTNSKTTNLVLNELYTDFQRLPGELQELMKPVLQSYAFLQAHEGFKRHLPQEKLSTDEVAIQQSEVVITRNQRARKNKATLPDLQKKLRDFTNQNKQKTFFSEGLKFVVINEKNKQDFFDIAKQYCTLCRADGQKENFQWFFDQYVEKSILSVGIKRYGNAIDKRLNIIELAAVFDETHFLNILYNISLAMQLQKKLKLHTKDALLYAACYKQKNSVYLLLHRYHTDPNVMTFNASTALFYAVITEFEKEHTIATEIVDLLLDAGANPDQANHHGIVPVQAAIINNNTQVVRHLLARGANPHVQTTQHKGIIVSLLDIAQGRKGMSTDIIQLLQKTYKVDYIHCPTVFAMTRQPLSPDDHNCVRKDSKNPMTHGIQAPHAFIQYLSFLQRYIDKDATDTHALHIMNFLSKHPAYVNTNPNLTLPFLFIILLKNSSTVLSKFLNQFSPCLGLTGIFYGMQEQNIFLCNTLTPLHFAIKYAFHDGIKQLLQKHAPIDLLDDKYGYTPLHLAVVKKDYKSVKISLQYHCDVDQYTRDGKTALQLAVECNFYDIVLLLVKSGADIEKAMKNNDQETAITIARQEKDDDMIQYLEILKDNVKKNTKLSLYLFLKNTILHENMNSPDLFNIFKTQFSKVFSPERLNGALNRQVQGETIFHTALRLKNYSTLEVILYMLQQVSELLNQDHEQQIVVCIDHSIKNHDGKTVLDMVTDAIKTTHSDFDRKKLKEIQKLLRGFNHAPMDTFNTANDPHTFFNANWL